MMTWMFIAIRAVMALILFGYDLTALGGKKRPGYRTGRTHDDDIWLIERNNRQIRASRYAQTQHCSGARQLPAGGTDLPWHAILSSLRTTRSAFRTRYGCATEQPLCFTI